jgi:hypothetical protein
MAGRGDIEIDDIGIGTVLKHNRLIVPLNQREYSWEDKEVTDLFNDLRKAIDSEQPAYFLGAIALTGSDPKSRDVTDGQQRLATIAILLSAMRDYYCQLQPADDFNVGRLETEFLTIADTDEKRWVPRLTLNFDDREYFGKQIASRPHHPDRQIEPRRPSHRLIQRAIELARMHVEYIIAGYKKESDKDRQLQRWINYITDQALVIELRLPSDMNAFRMFETLNHRGMKTTQVDIIKNYLFQQAEDRMSQAQPMWSRMLRELESLELDDIALTFLRHFIITKEGETRGDELFDKVEKRVLGRQSAIDFIGELDENASDYVALMTPGSKKWNAYKPTIRASVRTLRLLRVAQIRPLMLAVVRAFSTSEAEVAFRNFANWSVRFLIAGGSRGGTLEELYSEAAKGVAQGKLKTLVDLSGFLAKVIPTDPEFEAAFTVARASKNYLARYYLRSLEMQRKGMKEPEWVPNEDTDINLEHVLPENPDKNWPGLDKETAESMYSRLGNMALLQATKNSIVGNNPFTEKKKVFGQSAYMLTAELVNYESWTPAEIADRQRKMAASAIKTWPLKVK